jgi:hypothetical protein
MAAIYVSYKSEDRPVVDALVPLLRSYGHTIHFDQALYIGSSWRDELMSSLLAADAVLVLWSAHTSASQYVPAEVGAVRAVGRIGLLPVVIGDVPIPPFLTDLMVERVPDTSETRLKELAQALDRAIALQLEHGAMIKRGKPKVFISHRHKDEELVRALIDCMKLYFEFERHELRCTSVAPYRLRVGDDTGERLRSEIADAEVVLGILTTDTLDSSYVAFELGAAWGQRVWTCPLLARGADQSHIPDPIRGLSPLFLNDGPDCNQLLGDLRDHTTLVRRPDVDGAELADRVVKLVHASRQSAPSAAP